ncbi:MAG: hypothetical protein QM790_04330 [Nibricoccus sp.]
MTLNPAITRLSWLMIAVMVSDFALTLAGQPTSYWKDHSHPLEGNSLVAWAMRHGPAAVIAGWSVYAALAFALVKLLPGRFGMIAAFTFIFAHFSAASGWLIYIFHVGVTGVYLFSLAVAAMLVAVGMEMKRPNQACTPTTTSATPPAAQEPHQPSPR